MVYKEKKARELFAKKKYTKALPLLEDLYAYKRGTPEAEEIYYMRAECLYNLEFYIEAAYHFEQFTRLFPESALTERAAYLVAYSNFKNAPDVRLSQIETKTAVNYLQDFIDEYPESELTDSATMLMDQLRQRLELKMYNWANLYYKMDYHGPAVQAFELLLEDFPETNLEEEIYYKMMRSAFLYAQRSVAIKQVERFEKLVDIYEQFVQKYPQSRFRKDADLWIAQAQKVLGT